MDLQKAASSLRRMLHSNSPAIMAGVGIAGVCVTAYLTGKATYRAGEDIKKEEERDGVIVGNVDKVKAYAPIVWKHYIPPAISGVLTIGCIVGSTASQARRTAAAISAYSLTERAWSEYREKVKEEIGSHKEQVIRDDIVRKYVDDNPPQKGEVIVTGSGEVLCCELYTGRYFKSDMETLRRSANDINMSIIRELYVSLNEFYDAIGIPHTSTSGELGWDSDRMMELEFTSTISDAGVPCLAFNYNYIKPI